MDGSIDRNIFGYMDYTDGSIDRNIFGYMDYTDRNIDYIGYIDGSIDYIGYIDGSMFGYIDGSIYKLYNFLSTRLFLCRQVCALANETFDTPCCNSAFDDSENNVSPHSWFCDTYDTRLL